ncbi:DNA ligase-1 [Halorubrum trapanicum]|uniref:DNA ligase n=1 Tax=Halorubrum trapanicum TaxID=29284 RepID=A0A8J7R890_9EURY|nr:DNA ligase [Halorubrum trapanicum]MBP1902391.1 DNA ligase-1 [Halorubrum trapanicum]
MDFAALAERAEGVAANDGDIETTLSVADLLADAGTAEGTENGGSDDDLPVLVRFLLGRVFPAHDTRTLDVGPALCREAIARAAGPNVSAADVEDRLAERGEIGAVAAAYDFGGQRGLAAFGSGRDALTVAGVDEELRDLAAESGDGSESRKRDALFGLFTRCSPSEAAFLARLVLGEMRLGVGEGTVRDAVGEAFLVSESSPGSGDADEDADGDAPELRASEEAVAAVERALQVTNDYGRVAVRARDEGIDGLREESLRVGRPVQAMLAQTGTATDAVDAFGEVAVETKFDGARVQVHYAPAGDAADASSPAGDAAAGDAADGNAVDDGAADGEVALGPRLYSRNMDDVTEALPEIVEYVAERVDVPAILDGEVVAVDDDGDPLPFQEVLRRFRRKHDVDRMRETVSLRLHAFDCLHADGDDLLDEPLRARHERLQEVLPDAAAELALADDPEAIAAEERAALDAGHEGVMLKNPEAAYTPGNRGRDWLKRKPDVETLDAVVVGAEWGEGRRAELFGTFLLAVRDESGDRSSEGDGGASEAADRRASDREAADLAPAGYATVGKVATGITDEALADLTERLEPHVVDETGTTVAFDPELVVEVGYEEIQASPTYSADYALRFPRFVGVREDKGVGDADSLARVRRLAGDD